MKALADKVRALMVNKREPMIQVVESGPSLPQRIQGLY